MRQALRFSAPAALLCAAARTAQWSVSADAANPLAPPPPALSPAAFRPFRVARVAQLTHDTRLITVAFPSESDVSGASVASCLVIKATVDGKDVVRPYTPTSPASQRGTLDLIIKSYPNGTVSKCVGGGGRLGWRAALRAT